MPVDLDALRTSAFREAEEHFSQLVAGVQDYAIFTLDARGNVQTWNAGAARMKGYAPREIIGKHFSQFYMAEAVAAGWPEEELLRAARDGRFEDEGWRLRKDGSRMWANVVITALYNADGVVRGYLKVTRDLTERKRAEETLRRSEQRFRLLVDGVKEYALFMLDVDGRIASWNSGAERIKGYQAEEVIGRHFSIFYTAEDLAAAKPEKELEAALRNGSIEDEGWRVRKDGSLFFAGVVLTALYDDERRHVGFAKLTRDLSEKRKREALEVADRQKNEFLAMLAHELRNPLAPLSNGLQLLKLPNLTREVVGPTTELMERQLNQLVRLVDDLLDVSRVITGKLTCRREPTDLGDVVEHAVEESRPAIDARGHELIVSFPARAVTVRGDRMRLSQVVSNLLNNAAKYAARPGRIWLTVERDGPEALIRVKDEGIGIAADVLPDVFQLFVQADQSLDRSRGGLGIGLTVVQRIVEMHGGSVEATSPGPEQGSEFVVRLPALQRQHSAEQRPSAASPEIPKRRVLVVDDNVDAANTAGALFRAWGHEVRTAYNGIDALTAARAFRPEAIFLDIGLPGMNGYEVARQLRADPELHDVMIAALTGYGQESDRIRSQEAGFDYHLTKPLDADAMFKLLTSHDLPPDRDSLRN